MKRKDFTPSDKLRIALALCNVAINNRTADLILEVQKVMAVKGDMFSIKDGVELELANKKKWNEKAH